jgi:thiol-disulfide isomerase/thioredoxin
MDRKAYKVLIAVLVLLILLVLAAMGVIGYMLMTATVEELPQTAASPAPTATPRLLTSQDFEPDRSVLFTTPQGMLTDGQGNPLSLESLRGRETVLIFWSSWCGDCKEYLTGDFPQAAQAVRSSGAAVYLVCREGVKGDTREAAEAALSQQGLQETTLMDPDAALYTSLGLHWVPSVALLDARNATLTAKQELLDRAFTRALEKLCTLEDEAYIDLLAKLLAKASRTGKEQVALNPADRSRAGSAAVAKANELLTGGALTLAESTRPIKGGFILIDGPIETNCAFETLVRLERSGMAAEVAALLFG